jgi:hypothetical protein
LIPRFWPTSSGSAAHAEPGKWLGEAKFQIVTFANYLSQLKFLPDEFTDVAAENIDLTAKLLLNGDSMRWLVANCHALRAKPSRSGS